MSTILIKALILVLQQISFYSLSINTAIGDHIDMSSFEGKKILLVNTASGSQYAEQFRELEQLHQLYKDSLVIIVFPTNDFQNEPLANIAIQENIQQQYDGHFIIAEKCAVKSENSSDVHPIFQWLGDVEKNGRINASPKGDFYKFLLDRQGNPVGIFKGSVNPLNDQLKNAIIAP